MNTIEFENFTVYPDRSKRYGTDVTLTGLTLPQPIGDFAGCPLRAQCLLWPNNLDINAWDLRSPYPAWQPAWLPHISKVCTVEGHYSASQWPLLPPRYLSAIPTISLHFFSFWIARSMDPKPLITPYTCIIAYNQLAGFLDLEPEIHAQEHRQTSFWASAVLGKDGKRLFACGLQSAVLRILKP